MSELRRVLGLRDVALFLVVAVVGPRWVATAAVAGPSALAIWVIAAIALFGPLALTVVELSSRHPGEGGLYLWVREAFGGFWGFMAGWLYWISNVVYFPGVLYFAAGNALYLGGPRARALSASPSYYAATALVGLALAVALNLRGLDFGKWLNNVGALAQWSVLALLVALGCASLLRFGSASHFGGGALVPSVSLSDVGFWAAIAFAFGGLEGASFMGDEILDARRTLPRGILIAGLVAASIYMLGTAAVLVALPRSAVSGLQGIMQAVESAAGRLGVSAATPLAAALLTVGSLGAIGAWVGAVARLPFVAGIDRVLPPAFGRLHPRWGTPYVSLLAQAVVAGAIVVLGQAGESVKAAYDFLVSMAVITNFIPFLLLFAALVRLQREPAGPEIRRVPGGALGVWAVAALGLATTAVAIAVAALPPADAADRGVALAKTLGASLVVIAAGLALYWSGTRRR